MAADPASIPSPLDGVTGVERGKVVFISVRLELYKHEVQMKASSLLRYEMQIIPCSAERLCVIEI